MSEPSSHKRGEGPRGVSLRKCGQVDRSPYLGEEVLNRRDKSLVKEMEVLETKAGDGVLSLGGGLALARGRGARRGQEGAEEGVAAGELATEIRSSMADRLRFSPRSRRAGQ